MWIPGSYLVREFARHLSALDGRAGRPRRAAASSSTRRPGCARCRRRGALVVRYQRLCLRHLGARRLPRRRRAASSTAPAVPARRRRAKAEPHALALRGLPRRLAGGDDARRRAPAPAAQRASSPPTTTSWSTIRSSSAASGAARFDAGRRAARVRRRRRAARLRRRAAARRHAAHLRGADRVLARRAAASRRSSATCSCSTRVEDGHGGLEHRASTALIAPRRDLPRRAPTPARQRARPSRATATSACSA